MTNESYNFSYTLFHKYLANKYKPFSIKQSFKGDIEYKPYSVLHITTFFKGVCSLFNNGIKYMPHPLQSNCSMG